MLKPAFHTTTMSIDEYYGFYVSRPEQDRFIYQYFQSLYAAKHFLDILIQDHKPTWLNSDRLTIDTPTGTILIRGVTHKGINSLEAAMEHTYTKEEAAFSFDDTHQAMYQSFALGQTPTPEEARVMDVEGTIDHRASTKPPSIKPASTPREPKPKQPRASKDGLVTIQQIASDNNWDAKHCRAALRKAKIEKPESGWAFPTSDVPRITKAIKDNLK